MCWTMALYENTDKICLSLSIVYVTIPYALYSILFYCMNIHLFNIVIFNFYIRRLFPVLRLISESISDFQVDTHTQTHAHILLIVDTHSNGIIPASLFSAINIEFLCSCVHLSHNILCRLSCCCILFVSGRLFLLCVAFSEWIYSSVFSTILRSMRKWKCSTMAFHSLQNIGRCHY